MHTRSVFPEAFRILFVLCLWCVLPNSGFAQSSYDFTGPPVLIAGNDLQQGAVYRYSSVSAGTDALVEISALNMATLVQLDQPDGVVRALQPEIDGDAVGSYVEFTITFVNSGTSNSNSISGTFSAIDVDSTAEFDTFYSISDFTIETGTELTFSISEPQTLDVTGGGSGYFPTSESNTSVAVSFSVNELTSFVYRAGVNGDLSRQTALLFEPVNFNNAVFSNINDAPIVSSDDAAVDENQLLVVDASQGVLANDTDLDIGIDTDVLVVDSFAVGVNTYLANNSASLSEGDLTINSDGSYQFTPAVNYNGSVPLISYQVSDGKGGEASSTLSLTVIGSNSPPDLIDDTAVLESYDTLTISALANDSDDDGNLDVSSLRWFADLSVYPAGSKLSADLKTLNVAGEGSWVIVASDVEFTPLPDTSGIVTPVRYQVNDNDGETSVAEIQLTDGLPVSPFVLSIDEDEDDNGFIGANEINGPLDVSVELPAQAFVGDRVVFISAGQREVVVLRASHIQAGVVSATFNTPSDGALVEVVARFVDAAGNRSEDATDQAVIDITANDPPIANILTDSDNSGFISQQEFSEQIQIEVLLPATAVVNDTLTVNAGTTATVVVLTPLNIADGVVPIILTDLVDGDALSVVAEISDEAGNRSASGSDSAMIDNTAPATPGVNSLVSNNSTPTLTGTLPVDANYLLSVQVAGVLYAVGDGQLLETGSGTWSLTIPPSDALADGIFDVTVVVTDMAGNSSTDTTGNELTIDLVMPELDAQNHGPSSDSAPVVSGGTDQPDGTNVMVKTEDGELVCSAAVSAQQWSCAIQKPLDVGINALVAVVSDIAGNSASESFVVTVVASTDSDEDGIPDDIEGTGDRDLDGIVNYLDLDSDNDTIPDALETLVDRDNDGIRNYLDLDSDNDGIGDIQEAHPAGVLDSKYVRQLDSSFSVGENGLADVFESVTDSGITTLPHDTDRDTVADYLDHDSDNDGITDVVENGHSDSNSDAMRIDGVISAALDFDNDGIANYRDLDSDQDGITDLREIPAVDADGNGIVDTLEDLNADGLVDSFSNGLNQAQDADGDGHANFLDHDSDGDRKLDIVESGRVDINNDGMHDSWVDLNANGVPDSVDSQLTGGDDSDGDSIDDLYDFDFISTIDTDLDGIGDQYDYDANGDGFTDVLADMFLRLPDKNGNGRDDIFEPELPVTAALLNTGVGNFGSGCAMRDRDEIGFNRKVDLVFLFLLFGAVTGISRKTRSER